MTRKATARHAASARFDMIQTGPGEWQVRDKTLYAPSIFLATDPQPYRVTLERMREMRDDMVREITENV